MGGGFTLIEMLIVVAIIAILVVVSIPLVNTSLDKARQAADDANVRAAKAVAVVEYLYNEKTGDFFYNAATGVLQSSKNSINGYGQTTEHKGNVIKVSKATDGTIGVEWVEAATSSE